MSVSQDFIQKAAEQLWQAQQNGVPCPPIRDILGTEATMQDAYAVQQINVDRSIKLGKRLVGSKIGLTSTSVQQQLGVDQPDFGRLFADMAIADREEIQADRVMQPKVEAEIAFVLEHDLKHEKNTTADLIKSIAYVLPAIEVVGSRIANWDISLIDTIADNASCGLFVFGNRPVKLDCVDLINCGMALENNGELVSSGAGIACLGNPFNAALWLADMMVKMGNPLQAGDVLLTGALGPMVVAKPGNVFTAKIQGIGSVSACFSN